MPRPHKRLLRPRLCPATVRTQVLGDPGQLCGGGDVDDQDPTGSNRIGDGADVLPRVEHVEDDGVEGTRERRVPRSVREVTDVQAPCRGFLGEPSRDIGARSLCEIWSSLARDDSTPISDRLQEGARERSRSGTGLEDRPPRSQSREHRNASGVLGIDDRRTTGHRQDEVLKQRAQGDVGRAASRGHDDSLGPPEQIVVGNGSTMGVESAPRLEDQRVMPAAVVGDLHDVPRGEHPVASHPARLAQDRRSPSVTPSSVSTTCRRGCGGTATMCGTAST